MYSEIRSRFKRWFRPTVFILSAVVFITIVYMPTPPGLTVEGQRATAIFFVAILLWVTNALPLMITSLMVVILLPLTNVLSSRDSYSLFGNEAIFFILGAFILASGIMRSGLSTRLALIALRSFGRSSNSLLVGILCLPAFLSFWMSEHAVAAMMFPIVLEVVDALKLTPMQSRYGKALVLAMAWGCIIGGIATFLGGARAPLAVGILQKTTGLTIGFLPWAMAAFPTVVLMLVIAYFVLTKVFKPEKQDVQAALVALKKKQLRLKHITLRELGLGLLMLLTIFFWVYYGDILGLANIAIGAVVVAFTFKLLDWKEVEQDVNWGIFLMYGGAICLGFAMERSGAAQWLADRTLGLLVHSKWALIGTVSIVSLFLTEAISNAAVVALLMPLSLGFADTMNIDARVVTLALTIPSGLAFMLPTGTPATAIAYSSGFVRMGDTIISGLILNIAGWLLFMLSIYFYWPLIGFNL
jgi:sodium-dependent dicarboxylate transporter 2/3/5